MNALRLYFRLAGQSLRGQMQYRGSFLIQSAGQFLVLAAEFAGILALLDRFGHVAGWRLAELALFYGTVNLAFALADAISRGFDAFGTTIKQGDFDRLLLRPRSTVLQLIGQELTVRRIGRLVAAGGVFTYAVLALGGLPPLGYPLLLLSIICTACMFLALFVAQATLAFWTTETLEIMNTLTYGGVQAAQYPVAIYRHGFRLLFTFAVPLATVSYFPVVAILPRSDPLGVVSDLTSWFAWVAPTIGLAFLGLALVFWQVGVRHYTSTGS